MPVTSTALVGGALERPLEPLLDVPNDVGCGVEVRARRRCMCFVGDMSMASKLVPVGIERCRDPSCEVGRAEDVVPPLDAIPTATQVVPADTETQKRTLTLGLLEQCPREPTFWVPMIAGPINYIRRRRR